MIMEDGTVSELQKYYSIYDLDWHTETLDIGEHDMFKIQIQGTPGSLYYGMTAVDDIYFKDCDIGKRGEMIEQIENTL